MKKTFYIAFFFVSNLIFSQTTERFTIKNVNINTNNNEFGTVIPKDGSIYYSKSVFKNNQDLNELSANLFKGELASKGEISKGLKFPTDAVHAVFSNDGKTVYYSKKEGEKFQLFQAMVDNTGRWKNEIKLPFNDPKYTFKHPSLNKDNTKLFFVSDKIDSYGNTDIYYVIISNHGLDFSKPVHLNFYVNSPKEEIFPCVGEKDKLYFSSNGMGGNGGMDIFESFYNNDNYEKTANLGEPINSESDDFAFSLISDNYRGFLSSNRAGGLGGVDIYYFEDKKPTLNKCSKSITGYVKNKETQKPIAEATIDIFDSKGYNENTLTDAQGSFTIDNVECETTYDIVSYKEGYNGFAEVHTSPLNSEIINLYLNPEFPEGFKEEFDFSNEITVTESKTNKVLNDKTKVENLKNIDQKTIAETKKTSTELKNNPVKPVIESYDPLDYDPKSQPKKVINKEPAQTTENINHKEEVAVKDWDPLDYDPKSQPKKTLNNTSKEVTKSDPKTEVVKKVDYDPLDYDPYSQSKNDPKKKANVANSIEEARLKKEAAVQERQLAIANAKAYSEQLKKEEEAKATVKNQEAEIQKIETEKKIALQKQAIAEAKNRDIQERVEREQIAAANLEKLKQAEIAKIEKEKQDKIALDAEKQAKLLAQKEAINKERQQTIANAKVYSEQLKKEEETKIIAQNQQLEADKMEMEKNIALQKQSVEEAKKRDALAFEQKAAAEVEKSKEVEIARIEKEKQEKINPETDKQARVIAQKEAFEKERQQAIANAKAYSEQLKKEEEAKVVTQKQQAETQKIEAEKKIALQKQAIADAKNRDIQERAEHEKIAAANLEKLKQAEIARIEKEKQDKIALEAEKQAKLLAQKEAINKERLQAIANAKVYSEQLKKEEETKVVAQNQQLEADKMEMEKNIALQKQSVAEAKKRDALQLEQKATAEVEKLREVEIARIEKEKQDKIALEADKQAKILAQKEAIEKERQLAIANAKIYSDQLKKEEEAKAVAQKQQAEAQRIEAEKNIALQKQAIAEAKNRDIQSTVESDKITAINPTKNQNIGSTVEETDYYLVKKGDGLFSIAKNNNLTVEELKSINSLKTNTISEGQKLIVKKSNNFNNIEKSIVTAKNSEAKESSDLELISNVNKEEVKKDELSGIAKVQTNASKSEIENLRLARLAKAKATLEKLKKENEEYKIAYVDHSNTNNARQEVTENFNKNNQANNCNRNINGFIKNSITKKIITNAKIELFFDGQNIETASTNSKGEFFFNNVACDTKYTIICFKEGFDNIAKAVIDTKTITKDITILIQPNDDNAITSNSKVEDAKKTIDVVKKTDPIKPKTTVLNKEIVENKAKKEVDDMTYYVEPEEIVVPKIAEGKIILNPIYFDLDEWYLTLPARRELDKIILLMKLNPTLIIESGSHTDTQGPFEYNLNLSEKRSQETVGYLIANGADPDRISGRGYGETMPINHCLDGVKCSQKEHLDNRRTEFVILKQ